MARNNYPNCDNIWCGMQTVDNYKNHTVLQQVVFFDDSPITCSSYKEIMTLHEKWLDSGPVCKLYNRKVIIDNKLMFPEDISLGEDLIFNYNYLDCTNGKIIVINKCMYNYVITNDSSLGSKFYSDMFEIYKRINKVMYNYITKWGCNESEIAKYHNACFFKYEVVLKNTFNPKSKIVDKYRYNRQIMKSDEFITALNKSNCYIHPMYRLSYRIASYRLVKLLDKLIRLRNR
jgi:hypothetical protein